MKDFSLPEQERGKFLRENGLHSDHLEMWKKTKIPEREIGRKDKALAEAAALLIL